MFSPINQRAGGRGAAKIGGIRISGTNAGNSESAHSVSNGSFSGSGNKGGSGKRIKSLKSSHTIEKTYSDFFNLTQESGNNLENFLTVNGNQNIDSSISGRPHPPIFMHTHQNSSGISLRNP
jgi:hypothetical protein